MWKKILLFSVLCLIITPSLVMADATSYSDVQTCSIIFAGREYGEIITYNGVKACAQKKENDANFVNDNWNAKEYIDIECGEGHSLQIASLDPQEYPDYDYVRYCGANIKTNLNYDKICNNPGILDSFIIIGRVIQIVKWIVPFIIIVLGMVDFGKSVMSDDEKANSKALAALVKRLISGLIIFFIPTIILAILNLVDITRGIENERNTKFGGCTRCLFNPNECEMSKK